MKNQVISHVTIFNTSRQDVQFRVKRMLKVMRTTHYLDMPFNLEIKNHFITFYHLILTSLDTQNERLYNNFSQTVV